jgi:hypothetical protein
MPTALNCAESSGNQPGSKAVGGRLPIPEVRLWVFGIGATQLRNSQKWEASCCGEQETSFFIALVLISLAAILEQILAVREGFARSRQDY